MGGGGAFAWRQQAPRVVHSHQEIYPHTHTHSQVSAQLHNRSCVDVNERVYGVERRGGGVVELGWLQCRMRVSLVALVALGASTHARPARPGRRGN